MTLQNLRMKNDFVPVSGVLLIGDLVFLTYVLVFRAGSIYICEMIKFFRIYYILFQLPGNGLRGGNSVHNSGKFVVQTFDFPEAKINILKSESRLAHRVAKLAPTCAKGWNTGMG